MKNTMKKMCLLFAVMIMTVLFMVSVNAEESPTSGECGDNVYWQFDEFSGNLLIYGEGVIDDAMTFDDEIGDFVFDEETGDYIITSPWYSFKDKITSLDIEEGITEIGIAAFYGCYYLTDVKLPDTLEVLGAAAFCDCIRLEKLDIPDSVKVIYDGNFNEIAIKEIVLPKSLESLPLLVDDEEYDFNMCCYLESVTIPAQVGAFEAVISSINPSIRNIYNNSMEALIKFDNSGVSNYWCADEKSAEIMSVYIGAALESIEYPMTYEEMQQFIVEKLIANFGENYEEILSGLAMIETVPEYITVYCYENSAQHTYCVENGINFVLLDEHIHTDADIDGVCDYCNIVGMCGLNVYYHFDKETGLLTISGEGEMHDYWSYQSDSLTSPFYCDDTIKRVVINEGVTNTAATLFSNCSGIKNVSMPKSMLDIDDTTFDFCDSVEWYFVDEENTLYLSDEFGVLYEKDELNYVLRLYPVGNTMSEFIIPDGVNVVDSGINEAKYLKNLYISSSVKGLPDACFENCDSLESIVVDKDNPYYFTDEYSALYCVDDNEIILRCYPKGNRNYTTFEVADGTTKIWHSVFDCFSNINTLIIPASLTEVVWGAFMIEALTDIYYNGTREQWNNITIDEDNDKYLEGVTIHYLGEEIHTHTPKTVTVNPTCTTTGSKYDVCSDTECNEILSETTIIPTVDHKDDNGDYKCDYDCGYEFQQPTPEKELNFFEKIIEWFKNIFEKLFGWFKF